MSSWLPAAVLASTLLLFATPAHAIRCKEWTRLGPDQRTAAIQNATSNVLNSNEAKRWDVNITRINRCMAQSHTNIEIDFDEACRQGMRTPMDARVNTTTSPMVSNSRVSRITPDTRLGTPLCSTRACITGAMPEV